MCGRRDKGQGRGGLRVRGALGRVSVRGPHVKLQIWVVVALTLGYAIELT